VAASVSIVDSRAELEAARRRVSAADDAALVEDVRFWTIAAYDATADYVALHERLGEVRRRHDEATAWIGLVANELRSRRGARPVAPER
jgi:hypothetical protein